MEQKTFRADSGKQNYSQLNNEVNPCNTCNTTSMIQALDYCGWKFPEDEIFPEFKQAEDKLTMFTLTNEEVLDYYKSIAPAQYNQWAQERDKIHNSNPKLELKDYRWVDSYAPAEVHAVLNFATNKFMGVQCTEYHENARIDEIVKELTEHRPVVVSVKFGNLGHVLTLVGVTIEKQQDGTWYPVKFFADDTYGKFNMNTKTYNKDKSGNDSEFDANELIACLKPLNSSARKIAHFFKNSPQVS